MWGEVNFQSSDLVVVVVVVVFWIPSRPALSPCHKIPFLGLNFLIAIQVNGLWGSWLYSSGKQQTTPSFITYTPQKQIMSHPHPIPTQPNPTQPIPNV